MKSSVRVSICAERDLSRQYQWYSERGGLELAEKFLLAFDATVHRIGRQPFVGHRRRFRAPELAGVRSLAVTRPFNVHLIFYNMKADEIVVERVMHGGRDLPARLLETSES